MMIIGLVAGGVTHLVLGFQHSLVGIAIWWTLLPGHDQHRVRADVGDRGGSR